MQNTTAVYCSDSVFNRIRQMAQTAHEATIALGRFGSHHN